LKGKPRKHVPLRTCIACRAQRPKRELLRIVCTPEGSLEIDVRGKRAGRGAYICPREECLQVAVQAQRLSRALKCQVNIEEAAALEAQIAALLQGEGSGQTAVDPSPEAGE
jgi:predicted RNA-binding protein YlxR (DUF448 family)